MVEFDVLEKKVFIIFFDIKPENEEKMDFFYFRETAKMSRSSDANVQRTNCLSR